MMLDGIALNLVCVKRFPARGCYEPSHGLQATRRPEEGSLDEEIEIEGSRL